MNCWDILGIAPTSDLKEIQGAYAETIKQHHPEDDPEGFRRVREAYEQAKKYAKWSAASGMHNQIPVEKKAEDAEATYTFEKTKTEFSEFSRAEFSGISHSEGKQQNSPCREKYQFEKADAMADPSFYDNPQKDGRELSNKKSRRVRMGKIVSSWNRGKDAVLFTFAFIFFLSGIFGGLRDAVRLNTNPYPDYPIPIPIPTISQPDTSAFHTSECHALVNANMQFYQGILDEAQSTRKKDMEACNAVFKDISSGAKYNTNEEFLGLPAERYYEMVDDYKSIETRSISSIRRELDAYKPNEAACIQNIKRRIVYLLENQTEYSKAPECMLLGITREEYIGFLRASRRLLTDENKIPAPGSFDGTPYPGADLDIMNMLKAYSSFGDSGFAGTSGVQGFELLLRSARANSGSQTSIR